MKQTGNKKCIVFAGTSEGRQLYEFCTENQIDAVFCVATGYGEEILCKLRKAGSPVLHVGRMDAEEMTALFRKENPVMVIDATHPYALDVTENIRNAAERYRQERQIESKVYYRVLRDLEAADNTMPQNADAKVSYHEDIQQAVAYLQSTEGNIFATTGSKQAEELCKLRDFGKRVYLRILPDKEMLKRCLELGFPEDHMICMQGPFSRESNEQILRKYDIKYLLTKQSGKNGGYPEKEEAARNCGAELVVLVPPRETEGVSVEQMFEMMRIQG